MQGVIWHPCCPVEAWGDMKPRDATATDDDMESRQSRVEGVLGNWGVICA